MGKTIPKNLSPRIQLYRLLPSRLESTHQKENTNTNTNSVLKKIIAILIATLFCSCAAEKRLAHLLATHPELQRDSIHIIDTIITREEQTATTNFKIEDLIELQTNLATADTSSASSLANNSTQNNHTISASTNDCAASIKANSDGSFSLTASQTPDTIHIHDSIKVPVYLTEYKYKDKIVYKMKPLQKTFFWLGIIVFLYGLITILLKFLK